MSSQSSDYWDKLAEEAKNHWPGWLTISPQRASSIIRKAGLCGMVRMGYERTVYLGPDYEIRVGNISGTYDLRYYYRFTY